MPLSDLEVSPNTFGTNKTTEPAPLMYKIILYIFIRRKRLLSITLFLKMKNWRFF